MDHFDEFPTELILVIAHENLKICGFLLNISILLTVFDYIEYDSIMHIDEQIYFT